MCIRDRPYIVFKHTDIGREHIHIVSVQVAQDGRKINDSRSPGNAVWRRKDSQKWYGTILTIAGNKVGLETSDIVEIIDLRMKKEQAEEVLARKHYYPGWHMNKKSWYTIVLDGSVSDEEQMCIRDR